MRFFSFLLLCLLSLSVAVLGEERIKLSEYKWKNRVIVAYLEDEAGWKELQDSLKTHQHAIAERDLIIIDWNMLDEKDKEKLKAEGLKRGVYLLFGKDGEMKAKQSGKLNLKKWFDLIDTMPMRKREISGK